MKVKVVIGANFGDEGKGLVTSTLACRNPNQTIVVRYNGGGQAGHTVEMPDGIKHVFSTYGAGTFSNAPTYLSQYFIFNPIAFLKETTKLIQLNWIPPVLYIHPDAKITTPFDIMVNWAVERKRSIDDAVHGSCGLGINETVERSTTHNITLADLSDLRLLRQKLLSIRDVYFPERIAALDCHNFIDDAWDQEATIDDFIKFCKEASRRIVQTDSSLLTQFEHVVFEGAQGLLLDQNHYMFPHVTRSNTGLTNVEKILTEINYTGMVEVFYVTRSYLTRHGNGPLQFESVDPIYPNLFDSTNVENLFQGKLRYAPFNLSLLMESIITDLRSTTLNVDPILVVTCMNQMPTEFSYVNHTGTLERTSIAKWFNEINHEQNPWSRVLLSYSL